MGYIIFGFQQSDGSFEKATIDILQHDTGETEMM